jgi:DNA-directed RNA polymerase subunit RPC12/RpoP
MSDFKFACPVCGQHITADSGNSGTRIECPTCFRKIIVPQAPTSDSKLVLSAAEVSRPREPGNGLTPGSAPRAPRRGRTMAGAVLLLLILGAGAGVFAFREKIFTPRTQTVVERDADRVDTRWQMDLAKMAFPASPAAGQIHGQEFTLERTTIQGGTLSLRQGRGWPPDLGVTILLFAREAEDLNGALVEIGPERLPPLPRVVMRWKDEQQEPVTRTFPSGYALRLEFGKVADGRMPGKIYLSFPDEEKSVIAGTFNAEVRKAAPAKPRPPQRQTQPAAPSR